MRVYWALRGGESSEIYDGIDAKEKVLVYRIGVDRLVEGEVKIVRNIGKPKIINNNSRSKVIDIAVSAALFIEVIGNGGFASGWYETVAMP